MLEVLISHLGDVQFEAKARNHVIYSDQPVENGGYDEGMTPPELLLASMGTCAGYYAVQYLNTHKLATPGLSIRVTAGKASGPARLSQIRVSVAYPGSLDGRDREGLALAVRKCVIHNTLLHPPEIEIDIESGAAAKIAA